MNRRAFLALGASGLGAVAGCSTRPDEPSQPTESTRTETQHSTQSPTRSPDETASETESAGDDSRTIFVSPDGDDHGEGSRADPLATIQRAVNRARPGETVHVLPGEYFESVRTKRPGEPGNPITITGPPDAVLRGMAENEKGEPVEFANALQIFHSHIHLTGLTIDGLQDPENPDDIDSYMFVGISTIPIDHVYLENLVIKPHAIGNAKNGLITLNFVENVEVGEFKLIGPAGLQYELTDEYGHFGEVVYVGNPINFEFNAFDIVGKGEIGEMDETNNVHIHHIDNSAGHAHAELVDAKAGTSDVLVEYCTDAGGAGAYPLTDHHPVTSEAAISLTGTDSTLRWCEITNAYGQAVEIGAWYLTHPDEVPFEIPDGAMDEVRGHSVYGNRLMDNGGLAIEYRQTDDGTIPEKYGPEAQHHICGNTYNGETHGSPGTPCPDGVPQSDQIGHLGGDSPWA